MVVGATAVDCSRTPDRLRDISHCNNNDYNNHLWLSPGNGVALSKPSPTGKMGSPGVGDRGVLSGLAQRLKGFYVSSSLLAII